MIKPNPNNLPLTNHNQYNTFKLVLLIWHTILPTVSTQTQYQSLSQPTTTLVIILTTQTNHFGNHSKNYFQPKNKKLIWTTLTLSTPNSTTLCSPSTQASITHYCQNLSNTRIQHQAAKIIRFTHPPLTDHVTWLIHSGGNPNNPSNDINMINHSLLILYPVCRLKLTFPTTNNCFFNSTITMC